MVNCHLLPQQRLHNFHLILTFSCRLTDFAFRAGRPTLGNLIFMMWKLQIHSTAMSVKLKAKILRTHSAALYVPPWSSTTPRAVPIWFTWLCGLWPENSIKQWEGVWLSLIIQWLHFYHFPIECMLCIWHPFMNSIDWFFFFFRKII